MSKIHPAPTPYSLETSFGQKYIQLHVISAEHPPQRTIHRLMKICQIRYWHKPRPSCSFSHLYRVLTWSETRRIPVTVFIEGKEQMLFVAADDLYLLGIDRLLKDTPFHEALLKTNNLFIRFASSTLWEKTSLEKESLHSSILILQDHEKQLDTMNIGDSCTIAPAKNSNTFYKTWQPVRLLIEKQDEQSFAAHRIEGLIGKGTSAAIFGVGPYALRVPKQQWKRENTKEVSHLTKIHRLFNGKAQGIMSTPRHVISHIDSRTGETKQTNAVTISPLADCDAFNLLHNHELTQGQKQHIAHNLSAGLFACVQARIAHIDIKLENILIHAHEDTFDAELADFDDTIDFDTEEWTELDVSMTKYYMTHKDLMRLQHIQKKIPDLVWDEREKKRYKKAYEECMQQIAIFELGICFHALYTGYFPKTQRDANSETIVHLILHVERLHEEMTHDVLSLTQLRMIECMLSLHRQERPSAQQIAEAFQERVQPSFTSILPE